MKDHFFFEHPENSNGLAVGELAEIRFTWTINTGDYLIQDGDMVRLPLSYGTAAFFYNDFIETPIYDNLDKIGTIMKGGGAFVIKFSDHAVGNNILNGSFA